MTYRVVDEPAFRRIEQTVAGAVHTDRMVPDQVFRHPPSRTQFLDFAWMLDPQFWSLLVELATAHGDDEVAVLVLDPTPEYYRRSYGSYPAFTVPVDATGDEYIRALLEEPGDDVTGALSYTAMVMAVTGPSGRWACWGDRAFDLGLVQADTAPTRWLAEPGLTDLAGIQSLVALNFAGHAIPEDFLARLQTNYPS